MAAVAVIVEVVVVPEEEAEVVLELVVDEVSSVSQSNFKGLSLWAFQAGNFAALHTCLG